MGGEVVGVIAVCLRISEGPLDARTEMPRPAGVLPRTAIRAYSVFLHTLQFVLDVCMVFIVGGLCFIMQERKLEI